MDVYGNDYIRSDIPFMEATASAAEISRLKVDHGDVMITKDSETPSDIGIPAVVMDQIDDLVCGYHLALIKPNRNVVDSVFLAKQLATDETARYFGRYAAGSTRYGLSNGAIAKTRIRLAPLPQQQKIAAILTSIDTAIEKTEALIEKYQQTKAGLMHDLFTRGVLPNSQLRPPREQAPELYQETAIGWIPRDWNVCTLRSCLTSNPTNGIYKSSDQIGLEGVLMVGQTAFTAERSVEFSLCRRGVISSGDLRRYGLSKGNILVTRVFATVQGVGLPTLVPELSEPAVFESNMMRLQIDLARIVPRLLFEWLRSPAARRYIYAGANASNQCSVNQSVLNPMPVPCPHIEEQARIVSRIDRLDERHFSECSDLQKLLYQKLGLMQDLLTGKVPVKVGAGETANHSERHP
jgi:type I restriction enzyme S subunit